MNARVKGVFGAERRLFATPFSLFTYIAALLVFVAATMFFIANFTSNRKDPDVNAEVYRSRLGEVERQLAELKDPSIADGPVISYEGLKENLLAERELLLHYIESGNTELDYIGLQENYARAEDIFYNASSEGKSAASAALNMYAAYALCFAAICLVRGIWRASSMCDGEGAKCKLLCDSSRRELLTGGNLFDSCILCALPLAFFALRSIYVATGTVEGFYITDGAAVSYGNIHEVFFAQFVAGLALGSACYFFGALTATVCVKGRVPAAVIVCVITAGVAASVGILGQYCSENAVSWLIATPVFGIAFCLNGFRYYVYFIHLALCVSVAVVSAYFLYKRHCFPSKA